jgi:CheY-like chemotaxis protein
MNTKTIKILIVEDEFLIATLLSRNLRLEGYEVCDLAATAQDAIEIAGKEKPDVVLMDIRLAGPTDGIEAAQEIISRYSIPIIFTTGYTNEQTLERAKKLDPLACLIKPVTPDHIKPIIDSAFLH